MVYIPKPDIETLDDLVEHYFYSLEGLGVCNARLKALNEKIEASQKD